LPSSSTEIPKAAPQGRLTENRSQHLQMLNKKTFDTTEVFAKTSVPEKSTLLIRRYQKPNCNVCYCFGEISSKI